MATNGNYSGLTAAQVVGTFKANDNIPVTLAEQLRGSLRTVATVAERDAIPGRKLDNGMIAFVTAVNTHYVYKGGTRNASTGVMTGGNWSTFNSGSSGAVAGAGLREWDSTTDYAINDVVIFDGGFFFATSIITTTGSCSIGSSTNREDCDTAGGVFTGTDNDDPETAGAPWTRITLDFVENWDGRALRNVDGTSIVNTTANPTALDDAQAVARGSLGGNATESVDGFMSSEDKVHLNDLPETWVSAKTYAEDDQVSHNGKVYSNETGTNTTTIPASDTTNWRDIGVDTLVIAPFSDRVAINNDTNTIVIPGSTETVSGVMSAADKVHLDDIPATYSDSVTYTEGDQVALDGVLYAYAFATDHGGTDNNPTGVNSERWERLGGVSLTSSTTRNPGSVTITNNVGTDAVIAPVDTNNPGVMAPANLNTLNSLPQQWETGGTYAIGDQVSFNEKIYVALVVISSAVNNPAFSTSEYELLGANEPTNLSVSSHNSTTLDIDSSTGTNITIDGATDNLSGLLSAAGNVKLGTIADAWNPTTSYGGDDVVNIFGDIYIALNSSQGSQPNTRAVLLTGDGGSAGTAELRAVIEGVSTALASFAVTSSTTIEEIIDGLLLSTNQTTAAGDYTITKIDSSSLSTTHNDNSELLLFIDVLNTGFTQSGFSATSSLWQKELEYIFSRDINVLDSDPESASDGQVWYNRTEDLVKYFTAIDNTSETECLAIGGTFTAGVCSINGTSDVVSHTATAFLSTSVAQPDTGARARVVINDGASGVNRGVKITLTEDGTAYPWFQGASQPSSLDFISFIGGTSTARLFSGLLVVSNGTLSLAQIASNLASEITEGTAVTNGSGLVWNVDATVDPLNSTALIFANADESLNVEMSFSAIGPVAGLGTIPRFSPNWTTDATDIGVISNPDQHTAVAGQRFIKGSIVCFEPSAVVGDQAYIYLGTSPYTTTADRDEAGQLGLDPEESTDWSLLTGSGGSVVSGTALTVNSGDNLYYRQTHIDATYATIADTLTETEIVSTYATIASTLTETEIESTYAKTADTLTETEINNKFATTADTLTETEIDAKFATLDDTYDRAHIDAIDNNNTGHSWADYAFGGLYVSDSTQSIVVENSNSVDTTVTATVIVLSYENTTYSRVVVNADAANNLVYSDTIYEGALTLDTDSKITNTKIIARGE